MSHAKLELFSLKSNITICVATSTQTKDCEVVDYRRFFVWK